MSERGPVKGVLERRTNISESEPEQPENYCNALKFRHEIEIVSISAVQS